MTSNSYSDSYQNIYISKEEWLRLRFDAIVEEIRKVGLRGMPIEGLCKEAAEVACWIGEEIGKQAVHYTFLNRTGQRELIGAKRHAD
jgi:hypothetical protein